MIQRIPPVGKKNIKIIGKRFNLWLPPKLWRRLQSYIEIRSKEIGIDLTPSLEIRRAIERHLDSVEGKMK